MNKSDRYLCDDLERAALNREIVKRKIMLDAYPSQKENDLLSCPHIRNRGQFCLELDDFIDSIICSLTDLPCSLEYQGKCWEEENLDKNEN